MGLNTNYIGYKTEISSNLIDEGEVLSYLESIGSTNQYYKNNNVAPHIFNVVQEIGLVESIWKMKDLYESVEEMERSVLMLVHGEQKMNFSRLLKIGETINSYALIEKIQQKGLNNILKLKVVHSDSNDNEVGDSYWTLFIRASESEIERAKELSKNKPPKEKKIQKEPEPEPKYLFQSDFEIESNITEKYALASKDKNPIHLDEQIAKKAGLKGIIVHGLCTMAMTMDNMIDAYLDSNPEKICGVSLRFSSPVWPGDVLSVKGWGKDEDNSLNFEVENQSKIKVIKSGSLILKD